MPRSNMSKASIPWILLFTLLVLSFWIRIQGVERLPEGQFTEPDAYLYHWQASIISEHGKLPERDMHRWLPLGRDNGQTLNLYSYVLAYTQKTLASFFPKVTLYHVSVYLPVVCFCIGLTALCLFLFQTYGLLFSGIVGVLLATLPGSIERSSAGFGDRDAWCLMLGILAVTTYLTSLETQSPRRRLLWTLASVFFVVLGGLSWEGFGVFLSIILFVELWRFLTSETEEGFGDYILWVSACLLPLYLASPAYQRGYGFATHLFSFVIIPPFAVLCLRGLRYLLLRKTAAAEKLQPHARELALVFTLAILGVAVGYVLTQMDTFAETSVVLGQNWLMRGISELESPGFGYWVFRYGSVFFFAILGFVLIPVYLWKKQGLLLSIPLAVFALATFFRQPLDRFWGAAFGNTLFGISLAVCAVAVILLAWRREKNVENELVSLAFIGWFLVWVALASEAKRYDFFIGVALTFATAKFLVSSAESVCDKIWHSGAVPEKFREPLKLTHLKTGCAVILLMILMCFPLKQAHTYHSVFAAKQMRTALPGNTAVRNALDWMNAALPKSAVVAAHWRYGSQLNVLGGVKTITDQDTYIQRWIRLYYQHIINATDQREALEFLKTHGASHLMLVGQMPAKHFLRGQQSDAFVPVYPTEGFASSNVNVWELRYPPEIETDPKYLLTGIPEIDDTLQSR